MRIAQLSALSAALLFASLAFGQQTAPPVGAPPAAPTATPASGEAETGTAAWYGQKFAGRRTASGRSFNPSALTAAHKTLPFGTRVKVTNNRNNRSVVVTINDRGPTAADRIVDVSQAAARKLGFVRAGLTEVKLEVVGQSPWRHGKQSKRPA